MINNYSTYYLSFSNSLFAKQELVFYPPPLSDHNLIYTYYIIIIYDFVFCQKTAHSGARTHKYKFFHRLATMNTEKNPLPV